MLDLVPATLAEIRQEWAMFTAGVEAVIDRCNADFMPADVYREVCEKRVFLYWVVDAEADECLGFAVLGENVDQYSRAAILCVDIVYLKPECDALEALGDALHALAHKLEKDRIEWFSPRLGWTRVMERIGYQSDSMLFVRNVSYG